MFYDDNVLATIMCGASAKSFILQTSSAQNCETLAVTTYQMNYGFENKISNLLFTQSKYPFTVSEPIQLIRQVVLHLPGSELAKA
jgi:hypothetical protein